MVSFTYFFGMFTPIFLGKMIFHFDGCIFFKGVVQPPTRHGMKWHEILEYRDEVVGSACCWVVVFWLGFFRVQTRNNTKAKTNSLLENCSFWIDFRDFLKELSQVRQFIFAETEIQ